MYRPYCLSCKQSYSPSHFDPDYATLTPPRNFCRKCLALHVCPQCEQPMARYLFQLTSTKPPTYSTFCPKCRRQKPKPKPVKVSLKKPCPPPNCFFPDCNRVAMARGACSTHYNKLRREHPKDKICRICKDPKPYNAFPLTSPLLKQDGRVCDECHERRERQKTQLRLHRNVLRTHGLTPEDYLAMRAEQEDCCAICGNHESLLPNLVGTWKRLVIDHDHLTGEVRGLLCNHCNRGLGAFHDSIPALRNAIRYLQGKHRRSKSSATQIALFAEDSSVPQPYRDTISHQLK
jgi:hypothetical protein